MINYSFIIPHKNCFQLLYRCLASIPERDDIQIIVVDDNSIHQQFDFSSLGKRRIELYKLNEDSTAGGARNVGLQHVKGKWVIFADADDYFTSTVLSVLDCFRNSEYDYICHGAKCIDSESGKPSNRLLFYKEGICRYLKGEESIDFIKYHFHAPWWHIIRTDLIRKYNMQFEEVSIGNDKLFSYHIGFFAKSIKVIPDEIYVYSVTPNSIINQKGVAKKYLQRLKNVVKMNVFYDYINHPEWKKNIFRVLFYPYKEEGFIMLLKTFVLIIKNFSKIRDDSRIYIDAIEKCERYYQTHNK